MALTFNGLLRRDNRLSSFPICLTIVFGCEIFRYALNFDARARSAAFLRQMLWAAAMIWILRFESLAASLAKKRAHVPKTLYLLPPPRQVDLSRGRAS